MSYFDPRIYNKQNLTEKDRREMDFWNEEVINTVEYVEDEYLSGIELESVRNLAAPFIHEFCKELLDDWGTEMHTITTSTIDNYDYDVEPIEDYETYLYEGDRSEGEE